MLFQERAWLLCLVALAASLSSVVSARGQDGGVQKAGTRSTPKVIGVAGEMEIGRQITVQVEHLSDWTADHDPRRLVPYLNGRALKALYPEQINLSENKLLFHLRRTPDSKQVWADLFHEPVRRRPVSVSVGLEDQSPFDTTYDYDNRLSLTVIPKASGIISLLVILVSAIGFGYLVRATDIIRESGPRPGPGKYKRYNLERAQTAFWVFLVSVAFLCLWLITGDLNTLTPSVLALIGISGVTAFCSGLMKAGNKPRQVDGGAIATSEPSQQGSVSAGFFTDILSDANGYSFHRFQITGWTILLGVIFVSSVYHNLAMPEFSGDLLLMTGISAATYLGFELQGRRRVAFAH
jgi:hypothetical protein